MFITYSVKADPCLLSQRPSSRVLPSQRDIDSRRSKETPCKIWFHTNLPQHEYVRTKHVLVEATASAWLRSLVSSGSKMGKVTRGSTKMTPIFITMPALVALITKLAEIRGIRSRQDIPSRGAVCNVDQVHGPSCSFRGERAGRLKVQELHRGLQVPALFSRRTQEKDERYR